MIVIKSEYPRIASILTHAKFQTIFALIALCLIVIFDVSAFVFRPYDGMVFENYEFTTVAYIDAGSPVEKAGILLGDEILMVDGKLVDPWLSTPMYKPGILAGDTVVYRVRRGEQILDLPATMGGFFDNPLYFGPLLGMQALSVMFWLIGLSLCLFVPQDDVRARLAGMVWLLTGIAVASGGPAGASYFWGSATTMKIAWALLGFFLVALHLYFPAPSIAPIHRKRITWFFAIISVILTCVTLVDDLVFKTYFSAYTGLNYFVYGFFAVSVLISLGLLFLGFFRTSDPDQKRQTGIVLWGMALGFVPFLALTLLPILFSLPYLDGAYTSLFLILIPLSYAYVIHQRKLLKVDFIINRIVVFFIMGLLILTVSFLTLLVAATVLKSPALMPLIGSAVAVVVALPASALRDKANRWVSRTLYGSYYDHTSVAGGLSSRLAQALDRDTMISLLTNDLAKQMGIQQTALLLTNGDNLDLQRPTNNEVFAAKLEDELCQTLLNAQAPVRALNLWGLLPDSCQMRWRRFAWGELFVPIIFEGRLQGILILGSRIAGDIYSDQDISILATVAHQAALASANIQLVERLRGLSQQIVRAGEEERKQVARELHDGVLQTLSFVKHSIQHNHELVGYVDEIITTLRHIVKMQRTSALNRGLAPALEELVTDMRRRAGENGPEIAWRNRIGEIAVPDEHATAIYRIAQESLSNALKHARAKDIAVTLAQENGKIEFTIEDNGIGLPPVIASEGHYGLIGMRERALMIGANLRVVSDQEEGTRVVMEYTPC